PVDRRQAVELGRGGRRDGIGRPDRPRLNSGGDPTRGDHTGSGGRRDSCARGTGWAVSFDAHLVAGARGAVCGRFHAGDHRRLVYTGLPGRSWPRYLVGPHESTLDEESFRPLVDILTPYTGTQPCFIYYDLVATRPPQALL